MVQHVEIDGCPVFRKQAFEKIRDANDDYYKKMGAKKRTTATTTDVADKVHTAIAGSVPSETPKVSPAPAGPIKPEVEKTSQAPTSGVQSEIPKAYLAPPSRPPPRDILTDFESARKEAEYEEFKKTFPALKIQKHGRGLTDNVSIPKQSMDINSPTKGKAEVDLIEMSPNTRVPKHVSTGLTGLKPFNIVAGGAENSRVRKENVPLGKESPDIFPPPARPLKSLGPIPDLSGASNQPPDLRPSVFTNAGSDHGALSRSSNILQPFQGLKLGEPQKAYQASECTPKEPAPKYYHKYDPDQPGFGLEQYRNPYSKKYKCAFSGCT